MGDVIPFKRRERKREDNKPKVFKNTTLWGEGMFGFNPNLVKSIFIANDVNICFLFHELPSQEELDGCELMVKCSDKEECEAAYRELIRIMEVEYGQHFED